jgi:broad specificity phosphatase PhoE/ribonuclease HI
MTRVIVEADGGSRGNPGPAGYGALVRDAASGAVLREVAAGIGVASNNVAEYRGLIAGLKAALEVGADDVEVRMDSLLVVNQMSSKWKVKHEAMRPLAIEAAGLVRRFGSVTFTHIPRARNAHADRLANEAMDDAARGLDWTARTDVPQPEPEPERATSSYGWSMPTAPAATALLARHGETALSVEKRFSGRGDPPLTERGLAQAAALAQRVTDWDVAAVVSSPLQRARQTAAAVAAVTGAEVDIDDDLVETDFGDWEGHSFAEIRAQWPAELGRWLASPEVAPPNGETFVATFARVEAVAARLAQKYAGRAVVVVSHVTPIKAMLRAALGAPADMLYRVHLDVASLSVVDLHTDSHDVVRLVNDTSYLDLQLIT